jgi:tetratricopeptide (TPR) repeat protein
MKPSQQLAAKSCLALSLAFGLDQASLMASSPSFKERIASLSDAFKANPNAELERGHELYKSGEYIGACQAYFANVQRYRRDHQGWYHLGMAYLAAGRIDYAAQAMQAAIGIDDKTDYQLALAKIQIQGGDILPATENLKTIVTQNPDHSEAWTLLGRCYETMGRDTFARGSYRKAVELDPKNAQAAYRLEKWNGSTNAKAPSHELQQGKLVDVSTGHKSQPEGTLPQSRLLSEPSKTSTQSDLIPLLNSYHISQDAPHRGLKPSEIQVWEPSAQTAPSPQTTPTARATSIEPILKSPQLELDDL